MPFLRVYIHFVWSTKKRIPYLATPGLRKRVWWHMLKNAASKDIFIDFINGYSDHCHSLISLKSNQNIEDCMQLIKGESARWINEKKLLKGTDYNWFEWQDEYWGVSINPHDINNVREYIKHQEQHHKIISFNDEFNDYMNVHGFQLFK